MQSLKVTKNKAKAKGKGSVTPGIVAAPRVATGAKTMASLKKIPVAPEPQRTAPGRASVPFSFPVETRPLAAPRTKTVAPATTPQRAATSQRVLVDTRKPLVAADYIAREPVAGRKRSMRPGTHNKNNAHAAFVRVRGLPFSATAQEVADAFEDFDVSLDDVFMGKCIAGVHVGHPDGQAFIRVPNADIANQCVEHLSGAMFGSRYLELFATDKDDFDQTRGEGRLDTPVTKKARVSCTQVVVAAPTIGGRPNPGKGKGMGVPASASVGAGGKGKSGKGKMSGGVVKAPVVGNAGVVRNARVVPRGSPVTRISDHPMPANDGILRVRGIPFTTSATELAAVFAAYRVTPCDVFLGVMTSGPRRGAPDGQAYVRFPNIRLAAAAEAKLQGATLGARYIELLKASEEELEQKLSCGAAHECAGEEEYEDESGAGYLRFRGLPYQVTARDIIKFCGPEFGLTEGEVVMKPGADSRPSGECFVQFATEEDATAALRKLNYKVLDGRYIEVFQSSYSDAARNVQMPVS